MTYIRKVDLNQKEIVRGLRAMGYSVRHTHTVGKGFPDLAIGKFGVNLLVEVKREGEPLTLDEKEFFDAWQGYAIVGYDVLHIDACFQKHLLMVGR